MGGTTKANNAKANHPTAMSSSLIVDILIPNHISVAATQQRRLHLQFLNQYVSIDDDDEQDDLHQQQQQHQFLLSLQCYYSGSMWRGIAPILLEAPTEWAQRLIHLLFVSYCPKSIIDSKPNLTDDSFGNNSSDDTDNRKPFKNGDNNKDDKGDENENESDESITPSIDDLYYHRRFSYPRNSVYHNTIMKRLLNIDLKENLPNDDQQKQHNNGSTTTTGVTIIIKPPDISMKYSSLDMIFGSLVNRYEKLMIKQQTLSAWMSTLGGGYFFCRRLSKSLVLSQQQQRIAKQLNNHQLQQQCQVNEIFNWLYIGNFQMAMAKIIQLENEIISSSGGGGAVSTTTATTKTTNPNENENSTSTTTTVSLSSLPTSSSSTTTTTTTNDTIDNSAMTTTSVTSSTINNNNVDSTVYRQCQAARVLANRLQKFQRKLHKYHTSEHGVKHAIDDYQRIRLVQEDFTTTATTTFD